MGSAQFSLFSLWMVALLAAKVGAKEILVGGSDGFAYNDDDYLGKWAAQTTVSFGDTLVFRYEGVHNLYPMRSADAFDACDFPPAEDELIGEFDERSMKVVYKYNVKTFGKLWFGCQIGDHCTAHNMKVEINVLTTAATSPAKAPKTKMPSSPTPGMTVSKAPPPLPGNIAPAPTSKTAPTKAHSTGPATAPTTMISTPTKSPTSAPVAGPRALAPTPTMTPSLTSVPSTSPVAGPPVLAPIPTMNSSVTSVPSTSPAKAPSPLPSSARLSTTIKPLTCIWLSLVTLAYL